VRKSHKIALGILAVPTIGLSLACAVPSDDTGSETSNADRPVAEAPAEPHAAEAPAAEDAAAKTPSTKGANLVPALTKAQEQAIGLAEDYLETMHFSRSGLISQLKFEGFSKADATFAVDHIKVNWKEQAVGAAEDYLDSSHFSRSGLIDQLRFDGFTQSQAAYGVEAAGL
jgi:hypothetical protein